LLILLLLFQSDEEAVEAVRDMWNSNKNDLEKEANSLLENGRLNTFLT